MNIAQTILLAAAIVSAVPAAHAEERVSTAADRKSLAVTIYNDDLALVKDARSARLEKGVNRIAWRDVAALIKPETALLRSVSGEAVSLIEQNFNFDLLSPQKLLEKHVGRSVTVIRRNPMTNEETREKAVVLATNQGAVLKYADRIETGHSGALAFDSVPPDLRDRPTLSVTLAANQAAGRELELSYLTGGLSWKADYVAELAAAGNKLDLNGWVTLTNSSGAAYEDATLQLVAGTLNRVTPDPRIMGKSRILMAEAAAPQMKEEGLFEYHLYTLERKTTLSENQTKQVALLSAHDVHIRREYVLTGADYYYRSRYGRIGKRLKPAVFVGFDNKGGELGKPLPKGIVRVYMKDGQGRAQFVGEDRIEHTARNEPVRLRLGEAFDITADKVQTDFSKVSERVFESAYRIEIRNAKDEAVTVSVVEPMPGDWQIVQENLPHRKEEAFQAKWEVAVAAGKSATLEYRVRVK